MTKDEVMKKRNSRAIVLLDIDDIVLLNCLWDKNGNYKYFDYDSIKKMMNISHSSLLLHVRRLALYKYVEIKKNENVTARFKGEKLYTVRATGEGIKIWAFFLPIILTLGHQLPGVKKTI